MQRWSQAACVQTAPPCRSCQVGAIAASLHGAALGRRGIARASAQRAEAIEEEEEGAVHHEMQNLEFTVTART